MKHVKSRFEGINGLAADYYWYSNNGKKDKKRGMQKMENWLANVIPVIDGEEQLIRASIIEILIYEVWAKPIAKWNSLSTSDKIEVIGILVAAIAILIEVFSSQITYNYYGIFTD